MSSKLALIIGNSSHEDANLSRLVTPSVDVEALAGLLRNSDIGEFDEVRTVVNEPMAAVRLSIAQFFARRTHDDLLLLYFSGHGVRDEEGKLYLAQKDTQRDFLNGTAVPGAFITEEMDRCRSKRQLLILDCCHSGAFDRGAKGALGTSVGTKAAFEGTGYGRVVLTATDATQYAWEGDRVLGKPERSVFTKHLIHGLESGEADIDGDGQISVDELYDYVHEQVVAEKPEQTPGKWTYRQQGDLILARNPRPEPKAAELPLELTHAIENPLARVRQGAVDELGDLLSGSHRGLALAAHVALEKLKDDDSRRVSTAATESLEAHGEAEGQLAARRRAEAELAAQAKTEQKQQAREKAEAKRAARQKAEQQRLERERVEQERLVKEQAEAERAAQENAAQERQAPGTVRMHPKDGLEYVWIPQGKFLMGAVPGDHDALDDEKPQHYVRITEGFWLGRTPVTVAAYQRFAQETGNEMPQAPRFNRGWEEENHPIVEVSWNEAKAYCHWAAGRLPTEAEWEYAARGDAGGLKYPWGNDITNEEANYSAKGTSSVGSYPANGFDLYDMAGNVSEWAADWYGKRYYTSSPARDPEGPSAVLGRVLRGGSWVSVPAGLRSSFRGRYLPGYGAYNIGFRCVREVFP